MPNQHKAEHLLRAKHVVHTVRRNRRSVFPASKITSISYS